jgi:hypothetical protein
VFWGGCVVFWCSFWVGFWLSESLRGVFTPARNGRLQRFPLRAGGTNGRAAWFPSRSGGTCRRGQLQTLTASLASFPAHLLRADVLRGLLVHRADGDKVVFDGRHEARNLRRLVRLPAFRKLVAVFVQQFANSCGVVVGDGR